MKCECPGCDNSASSACAGCKSIAYCSEQCQAVHWKMHRHECDYDQRVCDEFINASSKSSKISSARFDSEVRLQGLKEAFDDVVEIAEAYESLLERTQKEKISAALKQDIRTRLGDLEPFVQQYRMNFDVFQGEFRNLSSTCAAPSKTFGGTTKKKLVKTSSKVFGRR